jgi:hypothetical protein
MEPTAVGMTLTTKIILGVVGVAVAGGVGYSVVTNDAAPMGSSDGAFSGDVFALMERGGNWKCTWAGNDDGMSIEGTVYVSGDRFRSESHMVASGMDLSAQAVSDGEFIYTWSDAAPMGVKFSLEAAEDMASEAEASLPANEEASQQFAEDYDYSCERWNADSAVFELPSDVTFNDFSDFGAMMQNAGAMMQQEGGTPANINANINTQIDIEALMQQYQTQ